MNVEPTILVLADGQPPEELAAELERHHVFTEFTTPAALGDVFDVVAPDLVLLFGRKHFDTTAEFLARLPEERRVRLAVLAARSELASFRDVDRDLVATVLSLDISTSALAARLATVALRLAQKIQERSRSVAPPAVTVVQPSVVPPRAPLLPKVSEPPRPRAPLLPGGRAAEGGSTAPVSMPAASAGPPRPVMGSRKPASRRPPEPEPVDDLSDRPTLVRDPSDLSAVTELAFDDRPTIAGEAPLYVDPSELQLDSSPESASDASVPESGKFPVSARSSPPEDAELAPAVAAPLGVVLLAGVAAESAPLASGESGRVLEGAAPVLGGALPRESVAGAPGRLTAAGPAERVREGAQLPGAGASSVEGTVAGSPGVGSASADAPSVAARADDGSLGALESQAERVDAPRVASTSTAGRRIGALLVAAGCLAAVGGFAWHTQQNRVRAVAGAATKPTADAAPAAVPAASAAAASATPPTSGDAPTVDEPAPAPPTGPLALWEVAAAPAPACKDLVPPPPAVNAVTVALGNRAWDRARAALVRGDRPAAHVALCDAAQNHPQSLAVEGLVEHYLSLHAPEQAKPWLDTALVLRPERPRTLELQAILESQLGHEDAARKAWQRSVGIAETDTATTVRLARMSAAEVDGLLRAGDFLRAEGVARRAATLDPTSAVAAAALASVWLATGQEALATLWVARAEELDPKSPEAAVVRGDWHARAGDGAAARLSYERAVELEPSNKAAWQKLGGMSGAKQKATASGDSAATESGSEGAGEATAPAVVAPAAPAPAETVAAPP